MCASFNLHAFTKLSLTHKWFKSVYISIIRIIVCSDTFIIVFMHLKSKSIKSMTVKCITMIHVLQYIFYLNSHHVPFRLSRENVYNFYFLFLRAGKQEFSYDTYTKIDSYDVIERSWYMAIWMRHTNLQFILKVVKMNTVEILHRCWSSSAHMFHFLITIYLHQKRTKQYSRNVENVI